jgi:hypothetical protein
LPKASVARPLQLAVRSEREDGGRVLLENELALCIADAYPVTPGHSLAIPRRHVADGLALHQPEWNAVVELLKQRRQQLSAKDPSISGRAGLLNARGAVITGARSGSIEKPAVHVLVKHTADQGLVGNALLQGTGTQGA